MPKRIYRAVPVQQIEPGIMIEQLSGVKKVVFGCDAAKESWRGAFVAPSSGLVSIVSWDLKEVPEVVALLVALRHAGIEVDVVAEPTGTYADAFACQVRKAGLEMFMVSPKHTHDYAEIYDGVPSQHDCKDAVLVAMIHLQRREPAKWPTPSEQQRELRARCAHVDWLKQEYQRDQGRTEALLARHWPELTRELDLDSATLPELLARFGSAQAVTAQPESARQLLRKISRDLLAKDKIGRVVVSAQHSLGLPPTASEQQLLQELGRRMLESRRQLREAERAVLQVACEVPAMKPLSDSIGPMTAAIFLAFIGDPKQFTSGRTLLKMLGLNLRERSSGKFKGQLKISKRGNSVVRRWIYLAALRLMKQDRVVRAWVDHKAQRSGGMKMKAIIALMRKIVSSLRHVTDGNPFDSTKLFDVQRLKRMHALPANFHATPSV